MISLKDKALESMLAAAAELEQLGRQRLKWVHDADWDAFLESEDRRGELARLINAHQLSPDGPGAQQLARRLERIRALDHELAPLLTSRREWLIQALQQVRQGSSGARVYEQVGRRPD